MAIAEISIVPIGTGDTSLSQYVVQVLQILRRSALKYELTAMGTIISGDLDKIWSVLREMHESCFSSGVGRVLTSIRIDDRRDRSSTPEAKVRSVLDKMSDLQ
jgi:uncharacterized protein (TIGR00106 family)